MQHKNMLFRLLRPYLSSLILILLLNLFLVAAQLYLPILIGNAIDCIHPQNTDIPALLRILGYAIAFTGVAGVLQWCISLLCNRVCFSVTQKLRQSAFEKLHVLPLSYLDTHPAGDILSRIISDAEQFSDGLLVSFSQLFCGVLTILGSIILMLRIKPLIACIVTILSPLSIFLARSITKRTHAMFLTQSKLRGAQTAYIEEMLGGMQTLKAFSYETKAIADFCQQNDALADASCKAVFFSSLTNPSTRFLNNVVYAVVALCGALQVLHGGMSVGMLSCLLSYATQYAKPFNDISGVLTELQNALVCANRIFALLEEPEQSADPAVPVYKSTTQGAVVFHDVCFSYTPDMPLLRHLQISATPGQTIAIVGPTGCGKTTLINLLLRFYDPQSGNITLDNIDLCAYTRHDLRKKWGMVLQDSWFAACSVHDNIAFGKPQASRQEVIQAAKSAHADAFIRRLPHGYDTILQEGAAELSEGEKQLLSIARIMLANPPLLILDEATSSIDTHTEQKIQQAFASMMQGRTCFVVAHRLSTIKSADCILAMENGRIVESGTHHSLLAKHGFYAKLYNSQFESAD